MKNNIKLFGITLLGCLLISILVGCFKDQVEFEEYPNNPWESNGKEAIDIRGEIVDEAGKPIQDVLITANDKTDLTDKNGVFIINQSLQNPEFIFVKAEKKGYFYGARVIRGTKNHVNTIKIILLKQEKVATIKSSEGGLIKVAAMSIDFPKNGFVNASGKTYTGNVNVAAKYLDPTHHETLLKMPGDLRAINFQGEQRALETYGMVAVELTDDNGNELNLGNNSEATLSFPKPAKSEAHDKIPLWYFDEKAGAWREDGISALNGNMYSGKVKHFSWWNCDYPYPTIKARCRIVDERGNPLSNLLVLTTIVTTGNSRGGVTGVDGVVMGAIPKGIDLSLSIAIFTDQCSYQVIFTKDIGSFNSDVDLGNITVTIPTNPGTPTYNFNGIALDCNGMPLSNGYIRAKIKYTGGGDRYQNLFTDVLGRYNYTILPSCLGAANSVDIAIFDEGNQKESNPQNFPIQAGSNDFGSINVCNTLSQFIDITIGDSTFKTVTPFLEGGNLFQDSLNPTKFYMYLYLSDSKGSNKYLLLRINSLDKPPVAGTYPSSFNYSWGFFSQSVFISNQNLTVTLTEVSETAGQFIAGSLKGTVNLSNGQTQPVSGSFRLRR